jgi:hypothetical protein
MKTNVDAEHALVAPISHGGSLSTADFDRSKWEIMYPLFWTRASLILPNHFVFVL